MISPKFALLYFGVCPVEINGCILYMATNYLLLIFNLKKKVLSYYMHRQFLNN